MCKIIKSFITKISLQIKKQKAQIFALISGLFIIRGNNINF